MTQKYATTTVRNMIAASMITLTAGGIPLTAHAATPVKLFGIELHNASRDTLRKAVTKAGLVPERVNDNYFCDKYGVNGQLKGASTLYLCYTGDTNRLAYAEYIFPSFMDTGLVSRVINMVSEKYGSPSSTQGDAGLGSVDATWIEGDGMQIDVSRGWPSTTTYLKLLDSTNNQHMQAEIQAQKAQQDKQQAQQQSNAF